MDRLTSAAAMFLGVSLGLAGCGEQGMDKAADAAAVAKLAAVLEPTAGTGPWFICDALNAPTVLVAGRPNAENEINIAIRSKEGKPTTVGGYILGAPVQADGKVSRTISKAGTEVGYVQSLGPEALPDPAAVTTPPITEVKLGEAVLSCRWLAHTRLLAVTSGHTAVVTLEPDGPVYRTYEFKDAAAAKPVNPDAIQRTTAASLEVRKGTPFGDDFGFKTGGAIAYSVGNAGVTTLENQRVVAGEPFGAVQVAQ